MGLLNGLLSPVGSSGGSGNLIYKGNILVPSDFPLLIEVQIGWTYTVDADVTDNDPSKTNTGQSFVAGDDIVWNGSNWSALGENRLWSDDGTYLSPTDSRNVNVPTGKTFTINEVDIVSSLEDYADDADKVATSEDNAVFVDFTRGLNTNDGLSRATPFQTIEHAQTIAFPLSKSIIVLGAGEYTFTSNFELKCNTYAHGSFIKTASGINLTITGCELICSKIDCDGTFLGTESRVMCVDAKAGLFTSGDGAFYVFVIGESEGDYVAGNFVNGLLLIRTGKHISGTASASIGKTLLLNEDSWTSAARDYATTLNQALKTTDDVTFASTTLSNLTANSLIGADAQKKIVTITNIPNGTTATTQPLYDNSTKLGTTEYTDSAISNLKILKNVKLATYGDFPLNGQKTIDGVLTQTGDRIYVGYHLTPSETGIYIANNSAPWTRATDMPVGMNIKGYSFYVTHGSTYAQTQFKCLSIKDVIVNTDRALFEPYDIYVKEFAENFGCTSYIQGGEIEINPLDNTQYRVLSGSGLYKDIEDETAPRLRTFSWATSTYRSPATPGIITYIMIDSSGVIHEYSLIQQVTQAELHSKVYLGYIPSPSFPVLLPAVREIKINSHTAISDMEAYLGELGPILLTTKALGVDGANLNINIGQLQYISSEGINYAADKTSSATLTRLPKTQPFFYRGGFYNSNPTSVFFDVSQDLFQKKGTPTAYGVYNNITAANPTNALVMAPTPTPFVIYRVYQFISQRYNPANLEFDVAMIYGQKSYASIADALNAFNSGADYVEPFIMAKQLLLGAYIVKRDVTSLPAAITAGDAIIVGGSRLKGISTGGGSGGSAIYIPPDRSKVIFTREGGLSSNSGKNDENAVDTKTTASSKADALIPSDTNRIAILDMYGSRTTETPSFSRYVGVHVPNADINGNVIINDDSYNSFLRIIGTLTKNGTSSRSAVTIGSSVNGIVVNGGLLSLFIKNANTGDISVTAGTLDIVNALTLQGNITLANSTSMYVKNCASFTNSGALNVSIGTGAVLQVKANNQDAGISLSGSGRAYFDFERSYNLVTDTFAGDIKFKSKQLNAGNAMGIGLLNGANAPTFQLTMDRVDGDINFNAASVGAATIQYLTGNLTFNNSTVSTVTVKKASSTATYPLIVPAGSLLIIENDKDGHKVMIDRHGVHYDDCYLPIAQAAGFPLPATARKHLYRMTNASSEVVTIDGRFDYRIGTENRFKKEGTGDVNFVGTGDLTGQAILVNSISGITVGGQTAECVYLYSSGINKYFEVRIIK